MKPSVRFEVFKRDEFACQYCGRKTPAVVLEIDHIIPRAEGGGDELENLVTACWDCNRGKGAKPLDHKTAIADLTLKAELIREREAQLRAYNEARAEQRAAQEQRFEEAWTYWFDIWGATELPRWETPWEGALRNAIEKLGIEEVKDAMDRTSERFNRLSSKAPKYFGGIIRRKIAAQEGRLVNCAICGDYIVIDNAADAEKEWVHIACETADA